MNSEPRKNLTREELLAWINAEIQKVQGCKQCFSDGPIGLLQKPDQEGCNWSDQIVVNYTGVPDEIFRPVVERVLARARAKFNVGPASGH
jgi:hypothetical protein